METDEIVKLAKALCRARFQDPDRIVGASIPIVSSGGSVTYESEEAGAKIIASTPYNTRQQYFEWPRWKEYEREAKALFADGVRA